MITGHALTVMQGIIWIWTTSARSYHRIVQGQILSAIVPVA